MIRQLRLLMMFSLAVALISVAGGSAVAAPGGVTPLPPDDPFLHTAKASNTLAHITEIIHPESNNKPGNVAFVTHNFSGPTTGPYHPVGLGVVYLNHRWTIFNQDANVMMPDPIHFNVMLTAPSFYAYTHTTTVGNRSGNSTAINHPLANNNPVAMVFITPKLTGSNVTITRTLGVWYNGIAARWNIFTQDQSTMPLDSVFNVYVTEATGQTFVHTATPANTNANYTLIDHPLANNNPRANLIVTQNWNPGGGAGVYNNQHVGVFYHPNSGRWGIYNENVFVPMPNGASFNVLVGKAKIFLPMLTR
jgi:hypothetical protein